jgi:hypothetical protein
MSKLALVTVLTLAAASNADADCAFFGLTATPITAANTALPGDGGIVIAALPDQKGKLDPGDAALKHPFTLKGVNKPLARVLAPGLVVVPVPAKTTDLYDQAGKSVLSIKTTADKVAAPAAPSVKAIEFDARRSRHGSERVFVTFDKLPTGTIAVVLSDAKGKPRSWGRIADATSNRVAAFDSGDCQALPNGTVPSKAGEQVIVQYVDAYGRLSPATKPMTITVAPAKP